MKYKKEIKKMIPWMLLSFCIYFLIQIAAIVPSYVMSYIIDVVVPNGNIQKIILYILLFVLIPLVMGVGNSFYTYIMAIQCRIRSYDFNRRILSKLLCQNMTYLTVHSGGELSAKAMQEVSDYVYLWLCTIPQAVAAIFVSAITLLVIGSIHPAIAFGQLIFILLIIVPTKYSGKIVKKNSKLMFSALIRGRAIVAEAFSGIRTIKSMALENKLLAKYKKIYEDANAIFGKAVAVETVTTSGIRDFLSAVFLGIAFVQSAVYVANGNLTLGLLVTCISLVPRFHQGIVNLIGANLSFKKQIGKYDELLSYLDLDTEAEGDKTAPRFLENALEFVSVSYQYDDRQQVLKDFSFSLRAHTWLGIEGRSGAGKSTIVDLILRLFKPQAGKILLDGVEIENYELQWYRNQIAYVPQEPFLFSGTIRENIEWIAGSVSEQSMQEALEGCCIADLIASMPSGLDTHIGDNGVAISGGEKQRIAVAIAVMRGKPLLILDEATSNMDQASEEAIREFLHKKVNAGELTILSVSHRTAFHKDVDACLHI